MFVLEPTKKYKVIRDHFLKRHPDLKAKYDKTIKMLAGNPFHPSLRLHKFAPKRYSISINMAYRISIDLRIEKNRIILLNIGTHREVYEND